MVATWKHGKESFVEQKSVEDIPKNRGAEQGDVDGPMEACFVLGEIANQTRRAVHAAQRGGHLPWLVSGHGEQQSVEQEYDDRQTRAQLWEAATPKQRQVGGAGDTAC